jgi:hypothetical protein
MSQSTATPRAAAARVILIVRGGVAELLHKPRNVEVIIFDYDVDGSDPCDHDPDGHPANIQTYNARDKILGPGHWPHIKTAASRLNGHTKQRWRCPQCGRTTHSNDASLAEAGTPYCPQCDCDKEIV